MNFYHLLSSQYIKIQITIMEEHIINKTIDRLKAAASLYDLLPGISTGFPSLDKMLQEGWTGGELVTIGGMVGMGKTSFLLCMLRRICQRGVPCLLFSSEMDEVRITRRLMADVCQIELEKITCGQLAPREWALFDNRMPQVAEMPLYLSRLHRLHVDDIMSETRKAVQDWGVKVVAIDYVQAIFNEARSWESRYAEMNVILRQLKALAMELGITVVLTSQLNREAFSRDGLDGKRPQLWDLRDSGTMAEDSDVVLLLHRPEYFHLYVDEHGRDLRGKAQIIVAKHRNGSVGDVTLTYRDRLCRFEEPGEGAYVPMPGEDATPLSSLENLPDENPLEKPSPDAPSPL